MRMPGADDAIVDPFKVLHYLLSSVHETGRHKARFFATLGYTRTNWTTFTAELRSHALSEHAQQTETAFFGTKYTVAQPVTGPSGRSAIVVTVWIVRREERCPRLVTAYQGRIR